MKQTTTLPADPRSAITPRLAWWKSLLDQKQYVLLLLIIGYNLWIPSVALGQCTTPPDQDFMGYTNFDFNSSLTYQCITYFSSTGGVYVDDVNNSLSGSPIFSNNVVSLYGDTQGGYGELKSSNTSNNFKIVSLKAEFYGHTNGQTSEVYNIIGFDNGTEVVRVNGFNVTSSGTFGTGSAAITYVRENFNTDGSNSGTLSFGSSWSNIDNIRFEVADVAPYTWLYLVLDDLDFEAAITPLSATQTSQTNVSCNGGSNGSATVTASGGIAPYMYSWQNYPSYSTNVATGGIASSSGHTGSYSAARAFDGTTTIWRSSQQFNAWLKYDLGAGNEKKVTKYTVQKGPGSPSDWIFQGSNDNSSWTTLNTVVNQSFSSGQTQSFTISNPVAYRYYRLFELDFNNHAGGYYDIADIAMFEEVSKPSLSGLAAGTYPVTITDAIGNSVIESATITEPATLVASVSLDSNASCNGSADGGVTAIATGGTAPYTYLWSNSATTASITGVAAGTYTVTITDANACTSSQSFEITEPSVLNLTAASQTNIACNGGANGAASVNVATGGAGGYTYNWTPGNPTGDGTTTVTGLTAGTWTCTVTDANACTYAINFNVTQPSALSLTAASQTNVSCYGGSNGAAAVNAPTGGAGGYTYNWTPGNPTGDGTPSVSGLSAGTWTCTVTDANACTYAVNFNLTQPTALSLTSGAQNNVSCNAGSNGAAIVTPSGGVSPYSYSWSPSGGTAAMATGLTANTYTVTVTDDNGCSATRSFTITEPTALSVTAASQTNVSCNGGSNGAAAVNAPTGGTGGYTYNWTPGNPTGDGTPSVSGLSAGTWTCTVTDANACTSSQSFTITEPSTLSLTAASQTNVSCNGGSNGAASVSASGGEGPYTYNWIPGNPTGDGTSSVTGLISGTWTCTITDVNGCTSSVNFHITQPTALSLTAASQTNISCNGGANGAASVNAATGGAGGYSYNWTPGNPTGDGTPSVSGLSAGTWTCTVTDANACTSSQSFEITEPSVLNLTAASQTNIACNGGANGAASVNAATGGAGGYSYNWTPGNPTGDGTPSVTGLSAGTWTCTVTDANACTSSQSFTITEPSTLSLTAASQTNVTCNGGSDGAASVNVTGGTAGYTYDWTPGNPTGDGTASVSGLSTGTWTCTVTDANGCTSSQSFTITEAPTAAPVINQGDTLYQCGTDSFMLTVNPLLNVLHEWYARTEAKWSSVASTFPGNSPKLLILNDSLFAAAVNGAQIEVFKQVGATWVQMGSGFGNGISNHEFVFKSNQGVLFIAFSNSNGNKETQVKKYNKATDSWVDLGSVVYQNYSNYNLDLTFDVSNVPHIAIQPHIGPGSEFYSSFVYKFNSYTSNWDLLNPAVEPEAHDPQILFFNNVLHMSYTRSMGGTVVLKDNGGNWISAGDTIDKSLRSVVLFEYRNELYLGGKESGNDTIQIYKLQSGVWGKIGFSGALNSSNSNFIQVHNDQIYIVGKSSTYSGEYIVRGDGANWSKITPDNSNGPGYSSSYDPTMFITSDGYYTGRRFYSGSFFSAVSKYQLPGMSKVGDGDSIKLSTAGTYLLKEISPEGCEAYDTIVVIQNTLNLTALHNNVSCNGLSDGGATVSVTGGTLPYTYNWSNNTTTATISGVSAGKYSVTVTDANGCSDSTSITITEPSVLSASVEIDANVSCNGGSDGGVTATVTGGTGPYTYLWNNSATTASITGLVAGTYSVTVTDGNGCTASASGTVTEPTVISTMTFTTSASCNGFADGGATVAVTGGTTPYTYSWSNGDLAASAKNMTAGKHYVTVTDANGCTAKDSVVITEPAVLTAVISLDSNESCTGFSDGGLTVTPAGGTAPYNYHWSNTATTASIAGITAGNYSVTVTDANGCTAVANGNIIVQDVTAPTVLVQNINAYLDVTGNVNITANAVDQGTSDACDLDTLMLNKYSFNCSEVGPNTIWFKAVDINGNEDSAMATVTVLDTVSPAVFTNSITVYLDVNGQASIGVSDINHSSTDACGIDTLYLDTYNFGCDHVGANTVALTAIDVNGNSTTETAVVTVKDTISPVAATQNITAYLDAAGQATINATFVDDYSSDACGIDTLILSKYNFNCTEIGANTVTLTALDVNGNSSSKTAVVTVADTISPVMGTQDLTVYLDASGNSTFTAAQIDNGSSDICHIDTLMLDTYSFSCADTGANTVTLTAMDVNGNSASTAAVVTVKDTISPVVLTQNVTVYLNTAGQASITPSDVNASTTDACGIAGYTLSQLNFDCFHTGNNTVTLTATDVNGNGTSANAIVEVKDTLSPVAITKGITVYLDQNGTVTIAASAVDNGSSDNCNFTLSLSNNTFDCTQTGLNLETFTITDASGNSASKDVLITVKDTISPKLHLHKKITVALDQFGNATISPSQLDSASSDNCSNLLFFAASKTSFSCSNLGENLITVTAYDNKNNSSVATAIVEVKDYMAPVVSTKNITVYLTASGAVTVPAVDVDNNSADNCTVDSIWLDKSSFGCADLGQNVVKLYAKDQSGNVAVANAVITVADTVSPVVATKNATVYLNATGNATITASQLNDGSTDNCSVQSLSLSQANFGCADIGTKNVTLTITDGSSNQASGTAQVTVIDTISPTVATQNIAVALDASGNASISATSVNNGSADACGIQSMNLDVTSFSCADLGTNTVNLTVVDNHGNSSTKTAAVTVVDNIQPVVATQDITIYLDGNGDASITSADINNGSTDNCGISNYSLDISVFDCADLGQNLVTLSATDASNNTASKTAFVTVLDTINPSIDNLPSTITVYAPANQCAANVQWPAITASDNCNIAAITTSKANGSLFSLGTTSVSATATDGSGNSVTQSFDVIVVDTVAPVISNVPSNYTVVPNINSCDAVVNWVEPVGLDNCGGISWTKSHLPGAVFPVGNTTVTYTATDSDNNSATITFVVTVTDQVAPVISSIPANITVDADAGSCDAMVNFTMPVVTDNCAGATVSSSHASGSIFPLGTTTVTFTATDVANNVSTASFTITVEDHQKPVVSNVPANDTVGACGAVYTYALPQATDNCSAANIVQTAGLPSGSIFPAGVTVNRFRISDLNGNDTTVSFRVVVVPQGVPTLPGLLEICESSPAVELTMGQNLSWSGNGIINGTTFDPAAAGTGRHKLEYTFNDHMGCATTGSIYVTVLPQPVKPVVTKTGSTTLTTGSYITYQWYRDGVEIPGATSQNLNYTTAGNYQVMVTNTSGCENYSDGLVVGAANGGIGIEEDLFGNLELYPNPSSGLVTIDLNRVQLQELEVAVYNTAGKKVYELHEQTSREGKVTLDMSHLPDAAYFIQIRSAAETVVKRVVLY